jgi:hypothetical protein
MGQTISTQHPAVVLRSRYRQLRALLAVAMIAVVGLTAAVVILAIDGRESVLAPPQVSTAGPVAATRSDGGPEESSLAATLGPKPATTGPNESRTAAAIGGDSGSTATGGPDESVVANAISGP